MAVALALLCLLPSAISIPPSALTYPEIGTELTKQGMPTEVLSSLKNRAAVIALHDRSPEQVRELLSEGLGVSFTLRDGQWTMQEDPVAKERNRLLMLAYTRMTGKVAHQQVLERTKAVKGRSFTQYTDWIKQRCEAVKGKSFTPKEAEEVLLPLVQGIRLGEPGMWIGLSCFGRSSITVADLRGPVQESFSPSELESQFGVPVEMYFNAAQRLGIAVVPTSHLEVHRTFDPLTGEAAMETSMYINGSPLSAESSFHLQTKDLSLSLAGDEPRVSVPVEMHSVKETFDAMGQEAADYLSSLQTPDFHPSEEFVDGEPSSSLSVWLQRLCANHQDAVMELSPLFDSIPGRKWDRVGRMSFASLLSAIPEPPNAAITTERSIANALRLPQIDESAEKKRKGERAFPWRVRDRGGVWVLSNPFAFLDRAAPVSPVPFLLAEREFARHTSKESGEVTLSINEIERLLAKVRPFGQVARMGTLWFRDLRLYSLVGADLLFGILDKLGDPQKEAVIAQVKLGENVPIDVNGLSYIVQPVTGPSKKTIGISIAQGSVPGGRYVAGFLFRPE